MASFRTAYLQKEDIFDAAVKGTVYDNAAAAYSARKANPSSTAAILVGDLVKLTPESGGVPAYIERVLSLADATHMVAQSDVTLEYGHVPVENQDYKYYPVVNGTAATPAAGSKVKKVALFKLWDKNDVIIDAANGETA